MKTKFYALFLLLLSALAATASQNRKVLILGIDGCRPDALQVANAPHIDSLLTSGMFSYTDFHMGYTISGPSWSDIMTGVWEAKNGVTDNTYASSNFYQYPYFPTNAKTVKPNLYCVQVTEWAPMSDEVYNDGWDVKYKSPNGSNGCAAAGVQQLADSNLDCLFVYFEKVDETGHASGFSPTNPAYIQAIEFVDSCVGVVLNALYSRPTYSQEDWLIIICTDHGGIGTTHGGYTLQERQVWVGYKGSDITPGQVTTGDPGDYQTDNVDTPIMRIAPVHVDVATTALHHLIYDSGINPEGYAPWNLDGKSWLNKTAGISTVPEGGLDAKIYPNPTTQLITLWFNHGPADEISYTVTDFSGKLVKQACPTGILNKLNIDLAGYSKGTYLITLNVGNKQVEKKVILQ